MNKYSAMSVRDLRDEVALARNSLDLMDGMVAAGQMFLPGLESMVRMTCLIKIQMCEFRIQQLNFQAESTEYSQEEEEDLHHFNQRRIEQDEIPF